jgi:hypothetical protein
MNGAMQAVMEVAQQVANDSQQTTEGAERLEQVVRQLQQLVGAGTSKSAGTASKMSMMVINPPEMQEANGTPALPGAPPLPPSLPVRSVRPTVERMAGPPSGRVPMLSEPANNWPSAPGPNRALSGPGMGAGSFGQEPPGRRSGFLRPMEEQPGRSGPMRPMEETPFRSGFMRPTERGSSGDPGAFPSLDSWNLPEEPMNPPTFQPPRRDPGRR